MSPRCDNNESVEPLQIFVRFSVTSNVKLSTVSVIVFVVSQKSEDVAHTSILVNQHFL